MNYKTKKLTNAIFAAILAIFIIISVFGGGAFSERTAAFAASSTQAYDNSDVLDDLRGMTVDGKQFSLDDYPKNENGTVKVVTFVEYCYSYYADMQDNFGLYVYVYNPQQLIFDCASGKNMLQMRVGGGTSADFNKYNLKLCNATLQGGYENLFYKFKVDWTAAQRTAILAALDSESRVYEVSGIELLSNSLPEYPNAKEYPVGDYGTDGNAQGKKFTYTGYGKGYGQTSSEVSLNCDVDDVEVVELEVKHTVYRPHGTKYSEGYKATSVHNSVASVYFAVPKNLCGGYEELTGIHAQWLSAMTSPMLITGNKNVYNDLLPYMGDYLPDYLREGGASYYFFDSSHRIGSFSGWGEDGLEWRGMTPVAGATCIFDSSYPQSTGAVNENIKEGGEYGLSNRVYLSNVSGGTLIRCYRYLSQLNYLFYAEGGLDVSDRYSVSSGELYEWVKTKYGEITGGRFTYNLSSDRYLNTNQIAGTIGNANEYLMTQLPLNHGNGYYTALFDSIADDYVVKDISSDDEYNLTSVEWAVNHSWFFGMPYMQLISENTKKLSAIQEVTEADLKSNDKEEICENLFISENDYDDFVSYFNEKKEKNRIYLFRFDESEYVGTELWQKSRDNSVDDTNAYLCQERVYLDFDIIHIKVAKDGVEYVIANVMSPIDIFPETKPPYFTTSDLPPWWHYAMYIGISLVGVFIGAIVIKRLGVKKNRD